MYQFKAKFIISIFFALIWLSISIYFSIPWVKSLAIHVTLPISLLIVIGIAYIPGYMNAFMVSSLLLDRQPALKLNDIGIPVTVLIACYNEEKSIGNTLRYISMQEYNGIIKIIVIDNNSNDKTAEMALKAGKEMNLNLKVIQEPKPGKNFALTTAIDYVDTEYVLTLDADTLLHKVAIKNIVSRILSAPDDVCAIAGTVLVRNGRSTLLAKSRSGITFSGLQVLKGYKACFKGH